MKKVLSIVLAIAMIASMATVAFAAADSKTVIANDETVIDVTAAYTSGTKIDNYKVDIEWKDLAFAYTSAGEVWDVDAKEYVAMTTGTWTVKTIEEAVTVTNHSSKGITIAAEADSIISGVTLALTEGAEELGDALAGTATSTAFTLTADGTLPQDHNGKIGTVTVTIGGIPAEYTPVDVPGVE